MIKFVPQDLLNIIFNKFKDYYQQYLTQRHYTLDQVIYNKVVINLIFNLNSNKISSCKTYSYKDNIYCNINISAGDDIDYLTQDNLSDPAISQIILDYFKCIIAHEVLHLIQSLNPNKYLPYKKEKYHSCHELRDIEFYPNLINYQYQAKDNLLNFISQNYQINNIMVNDYNRYKKIVKILYKENNG